MDKLETILTILQLDNLYKNFKREKVDVDIIPELTNQDLYQLGVKTIGERNKLKHLCQSELRGSNLLWNNNNMGDETQVKQVVGSKIPPSLGTEGKSPPLLGTGDSWNRMSNNTSSASPARYQYNDVNIPQNNNGADGAPSRGKLDVTTGNKAVFRVGDYGNVNKIGDTIEADEIEQMQTIDESGASHSSTNRHTGIPANSRIQLGDNAVFDIGNHNNITTKGCVIKAKKIGSYSSKNTSH